MGEAGTQREREREHGLEKRMRGMYSDNKTRKKEKKKATASSEHDYDGDTIRDIAGAESARSR